MPVLYVLAMFVVPLIAGIVLGFIQLGVYRAVRRRNPESIPAFVILFARGLLAFFIIAVVLAMATRAFKP